MNRVHTAIITSTGAEAVIEDVNVPYATHWVGTSTVDLWAYLESYKVFQIPIVHFFLVYLVIYIINRLTLNCRYDFLVTVTLIITIAYSLIINPEIRYDWWYYLVELLLVLYLVNHGCFKKLI